MLDTKALAAATAAIVREHVDKALAPVLADNAALRERVNALEALIGDRFSAVTVEQVKSMLDARIVALPAAADGKDGRDGKDADPATIRGMVAEAVAALPPAPAGAPGPKGENGEPGADGKDGAGIADLVIDRDGALVASFTDGRLKNLGVVVGKDGHDGADGRDGNDGVPFGVEDLAMELLEDGRTIRMAFEKADKRYAFDIPIPAMIYRGVYRDGQPYSEGDTVTWAGSLWHANKATAGKPDDGDWTLCVKKGSNGKDAR